MDPLSDFLPAMRVQSAVYTRVEAKAPWGIDFNAYHHCKFGVVLAGECLVSVAGAADVIRLSAGSCYLLPRGEPFTLRDHECTPLVNFEDLLHLLDGRLLRIGGEDPDFGMVGGRFIFTQGSTPPLLNILPSIIHFKVNELELAALQATLQLLATEYDKPRVGSQRMIDRIAEIFFLQTLRGFIHSDQSENLSWLGRVSDHQIAKALRLIHEHSEHAWTIESIAGKVGMSRSVFAQRFKQLMGETTMEYLTRCRIHKASRLLRESGLSIGEIAVKAGYESDASFSKAFKKYQGIAPGKYRAQAELAIQGE